MGRFWVLDTGTKGTGAEMVPLEKVLKRPATKGKRLFAPAKRATRPAEPAEQPPPPKFKVVDVMTGQVLAEGAGAREAVDLLARARTVVDVRIYVWESKSARWRLLSHRDHKLLWGFRGRGGPEPRRTSG